MLFRDIIDESVPPKLSQQDLADLYNIGILPAVKTIIPQHGAHWPPSYRAAMDLYRDQRGEFRFGSVDIPAKELAKFATELRGNLKDHVRLKSFVFMIEMRGTKGMFTFPHGHAVKRRRAFNLFMEDLKMTGERENNEAGKWHVDVGLEVSRPGHVLQWRAAAQERLLAHALPSETPGSITRLVNGSYFHEDVSAHLYDLAGFRVEPHSRGTDDKVAYVNVYTTDKAVTYQLHQGAFSAHTCTSLFPGTVPRLLRDIDSIGQMFLDCAGAAGGDVRVQDGTARFEVRVELTQVLFAVPTFPRNLLARSIVCIPSEVWW